MQQALRILMTNNTLAHRAGSEVYLRDLAIALMRRGHQPVAYSTVTGEIAEDLRQATIPVITSLEELNIAPDIIHGQHHLETMTAMLHFPDVPAIYTCHGWAPWPETPPVFPRIRKYMAVDDLCREKIYTTPGIRPEQVEVLYNFVDLSRFRRRPALPARPEKALVFSNYVSKGSRMLKNIRAACAHMGIRKVDVVGAGAGNAAAHPENILPEYDLVFAKARCALEALACGCAVVIAGDSGLGGLVTTENMRRMRSLNFGIRAMQDRKASVGNVLSEVEKYDAEDANQVSRWVRRDADLESVVDRWIEIYQTTVDDWKNENHGDLRDESRAAARYLHFLSDTVKNSRRTRKANKAAEEEANRREVLNKDLQQRVNALAAELESLKRSMTLSHEKWMRQKALNDGLRKKLNTATAQLQAIRNSRTWRLFSPYRRVMSWIRK